MKRRQEQGESNGTTLMEGSYVYLIIVTITTTTTVAKDQLKKQIVEGFREVNTRPSSSLYAIWK